MKRLVFLIILILITENAFGQLNVWRLQNPPVQENTLTSVQMLSKNTIVACGNVGTFIKTTDGGITWDVKNFVIGDSLNLYALHFLDANYGMICGEGGRILKTTDGGNSWNRLITPTNAALNGIVVIDRNIAIAVGSGGMIVRTTDGGTSWLPVPFESSGEYTGIRKLRPDFITITGRFGVLYKSTDLGSTWKRISLRTDTSVIGNDIHGQIFYDDNTAILVGDLGGIFTTINGGKTWAIHSVIQVSAATLNAIDGKDPSGNTYAVVGDYGTTFNSTTRGYSWNKVNLGIADTINSISFFDQLNGVAVGKHDLIITTADGGASWKFIPFRPVTDQLHGVAFPKGDTSLGIAVGRYGDIMRTTNGGAHWDLIPDSVTTDLTSVTFLSPSELCAVGLHGMILRSHDTGLHWSQIAGVTTKHFNSVCFPTPSFGWAVGDSGIVVSTLDGGSSWTIHPFSRKRSFCCVTFSDSLQGYIGSDHGVYITTDGGVTWANPDDVTYYLYCSGISSPSPNEVRLTHLPCDYADKSGILLSHDGGKNWIAGTIINQVNNLFSGIFFADDIHGTAIGYIGLGSNVSGYIVHTTDGGLTWKEQDSRVFDYLLGVSFGTKNAGTVVGGNGTIIRITTDE